MPVFESRDMPGKGRQGPPAPDNHQKQHDRLLASEHCGEPNQSSRPPRFRRRKPDRRQKIDRRGKITIPPPTRAEIWQGRVRALASDPTCWLIALFMTSVGLKQLLISMKVGGGITASLDWIIMIMGATAILVYGRKRSAVLEKEANDAVTECRRLGKLLGAMQAKLAVVQSNLNLAIADCDDLRELNEVQARKMTGMVQQNESNRGASESDSGLRVAEDTAAK
jgi:hypothetical protein